MKIHNISPKKDGAQAAAEVAYCQRHGLRRVTVRFSESTLTNLSETFPGKTTVEIVRDAVEFYASLYR